MYTIVELLEKRETFTILASFPGSPPPFLFFVGARGEPGNEAITIYLYICVYFVVHTYSYGVIVQYVYYT